MICQFRHVLLFAGLLLFAGQAAARLCGDDVDGVDIPCRCGDTVVSDLVLTDDPVTTEHCRANGLIVRVPPGSDGAQIDLNGKTLRGIGRGSGIWVNRGGRNGVRVISSEGAGGIDGFRDGIVGRSKGSIAVIDNVQVLNAARDGVRVFADGVQIRDSMARNSGRDGFAVRGKAWILKNLRADTSRRFGFNVTGSLGSVGVRRSGLTAEKSGRAGFNLMGTSHRVVDCIASDGGDGIIAAGTSHEIVGCVVQGNLGVGINGTASSCQVGGNFAQGNGEAGIRFHGHDLHDLGENIAYDNGQRSGDGESGPQCEIGGATCR